MLAQWAQTCPYWGRVEVWHYAKPILHSGLAGVGFGVVVVAHSLVCRWRGWDRRLGPDRRAP